MFNTNRILRGLFGNMGGGTMGERMLGGLALGALSGRRGRRLGRKALKYGAIAAVAGLAWSAWQDYQKRQDGGSTATPPPPGSSPEPAPETPPPGSGFLPDADDTEATDRLGKTLIRAMIAAARADGKLDAGESERILGEIDSRELSGDDKAALLDELNRPATIDQLVAESTGPEMAAEIYVASRLAIEVDSDAERTYLTELARRLGLDEGYVNELNQRLDQL